MGVGRTCTTQLQRLHIPRSFIFAVLLVKLHTPKENKNKANANKNKLMKDKISY